MSSDTVRDCDSPWRWVILEANGFMRPCCFGSASVGKIDSRNPRPGELEEAWNSPTMMSLRATLGGGRIHSICRNSSCKYVEGSRAAGEPPSTAASVPDSFDESWYVRNHHDVEEGLIARQWRSGREHYLRFGHLEHRAVNADELARIREAGKAASSAHALVPGPEYSAALSWSAPAREEGGALLARVTGRNTGRLGWTEVSCGARVFDSLVDLEKRLPLREYRCEKAGEVLPGGQVELNLSIAVEDLPPGRAFIVFELTREGSDAAISAQPLVLGVVREANGLRTIVGGNAGQEAWKVAGRK